MIFIRSNKKKLFIFFSVCFTVMALNYIRIFSVIPGKLTMIEGEEYVYDFKSPFMINIEADKEGVISVNNGQIKSAGRYFTLSSPLSFKTEKNGSVNLKMRIFGLIPFKTVQVDVVPNKKIIACGNTVGVKLDLNGILVIGLSDVQTADGQRTLPAREVGIKTGDMLLEINKVQLKSIDDLISQIDKSNGQVMEIKYKRGNTYEEAKLKPVKAADDKKYHIGLWVRDSTAGIGTLTFYDPDTKSFGALGHGITDIDTGTLMPVETGEILQSNILGVKVGKPGSPGELKGCFVEDNKLGIINKNCEHGVYGKLNGNAGNFLGGKLYPIALRSQVKEGAAAILANIDGKNVEQYTIDIQKVFKQSTKGTKGMIIKITDKRLLETTGGIVQGMSGSPIIQDEKIVGAVTHVLINDPTRGYGVFIEWMLQNINTADQQEKVA